MMPDSTGRPRSNDLIAAAGDLASCLHVEALAGSDLLVVIAGRSGEDRLPRVYVRGVQAGAQLSVLLAGAITRWMDECEQPRADAAGEGGRHV